MKKTFICIISFMFVIQFLPAPFWQGEAQAFGGGDGSPGDPYIILTAEDLSDIRKDLSKRYILGKDIDLDGYDYDGDGPDTGGWMPIGDTSVRFSGKLDGNGYTIRNMTINRPSLDAVGLFGYIDNNAQLENIRLLDIHVTGRSSIGGLAGWSYNGSIVDHSYVTGSISGTESVGGLVGNNNSGNVQNSYAAVNVNGNVYVGGLAGVNGGTIHGSYATGYVNGDERVGGLTGINNGGIIESSYATGNVSGTQYIAGLSGWNYNGGVIRDSYATGSASGSQYIAGLVAWNYSNGSSVVNSYALGLVTGASNVGGLVARDDGSGVNVNAYWNTETSGQPTSASGTGKTTTEMKSRAAYPNHDFDNVWGIREGETYPYLLAYKPELSVDPLAATMYNLSPGQDMLSVTGTIRDNSIGEKITIDYVVKDSLNVTVASATYSVYADGGVQPIACTISLMGLSDGAYTLHVTATDTYNAAVAEAPLAFAVNSALPVSDPEPSVPSEIAIRGALEITIPASGQRPVTEQYEADVLDEDGEVMPDEKVQWSVTTAEGVSIDPVTGLLTVPGEALAGQLTVKATLFNDTAISGEINVMLRAGSVEPQEPDTEAPQWQKDDTLTVSGITQTSVNLSWPEATDNVGVTGYRIYVGDKERTSVSESVYTTNVLDLEADTEYTFHVKAYDEAGNESIPLTIMAKTLPEPAGPEAEAPRWPRDSELIVSDITQTSVKLSWPSATDKVGVTGYRIYVDDDNWQPQTVLGNVFEYTVTNLHADTTYTFSVKAFNGAGKENDPLSKLANTSRSLSGGWGGGVLSNNADLQNLQIWANDQKLELSPSFASGTTAYTAHTAAEQVEIVVKEANSAAKVIFKDKVIVDKVKVDLEEGDNTFELTVQAENGKKKNYTLTIRHETPTQSKPVIVFTDISGHWAEIYIKRAAAKGIVSGYPDGTLRPNHSVTRAEFAVMLANVMKLEVNGAVLTFTDNDQIGAWAKLAVAQAVQSGIVGGYGDGSFRPNNQVTRAEMATMIARALKLQLDANAITGFADDEAIPSWAKGAVEAIRKLGLVDGRGGNRFAAKEIATRAEATVMLLRMLELKID